MYTKIVPMRCHKDAFNNLFNKNDREKRFLDRCEYILIGFLDILTNMQIFNPPDEFGFIR